MNTTSPEVAEEIMRKERTWMVNPSGNGNRAAAPEGNEKTADGGGDCQGMDRVQEPKPKRKGGYWAGMTAEERSAEMVRRQAVRHGRMVSAMMGGKKSEPVVAAGEVQARPGAGAETTPKLAAVKLEVRPVVSFEDAVNGLRLLERELRRQLEKVEAAIEALEAEIE